MRTRLLLLLVTLLVAGTSVIARAEASGLSVVDARVRGLLPAKTTTAAFLTLINRSGRDETLVKVKSVRVGGIEIHGHSHEGGMMRMREVKVLSVPANSETSLSPGAFHLMLFDVDSALSVGETLAMDLIFESGLQLKANAKVISVLQE